MRNSTTQKLHNLADACIRLGEEERPELLWLKEKYNHIQQFHQCKSKAQTDQLLYERMYHRPPQKASDTLKLRYWRTGRCTPGNRDQCRLLGTALELSEADMECLIQQYYDRSLTLYTTGPAITAPEAPAYLEKCEQMKLLASSYLSRVSKKRLADLHIPEEQSAHYLRHLYFTDAFNYVHMPEVSRKLLVKHITSARYDSELTRQLKLLGEIPRKTMIRHLLILGLPEFTLEKMNQHLQSLGYLPLTETHSATGGERLDWLLIHLFELYEKECASLPAHDRLDWFQQASRILDAHFISAGTPRLRFMYFKALSL